MKLGNNGWGMKELIIYSCILLSFLFFSMFMLDSFYADLEKSSGSVVNSINDDSDINRYYDYEVKMKSAVVNYINDDNVSIDNGDFVVDLDTLINLKYIDPLYDSSDDSMCSGYVIAKSNSGVFSMKPYLICSSYKTSDGVK